MNSSSAQADLAPASSGEVSRGNGYPEVNVALVVTIGCLWLQLFYTVMPIWIHGDYYDYAWFVPPLAAFFFFQRWRQRSRIGVPPTSGFSVLTAAVVLFPVLLTIRAFEGFDPSWRPPMLLHALIVTILSHWLLWKFCGKRVSLGMIPVTIYALSAVPYPFQLEQTVIQVLTKWVVKAAGSLFYLVGRPVVATGGILEYNGTKVEVTDGCSGIQSLQSLVMVALCFGEFFRVRIAQRFLLVGLAGVVALTVNVGRAMYLARVRFDQGEEAFHAAHDGVGHAAFAIGGFCLLMITRFLISWDGRKRKTLRRSKVKPS